MPPIVIRSFGFWIAVAFVLISLYEICRYLFLYGRVSFYRQSPVKTNPDHPPVSIIICAKNEADNLTEFLPKILSQEYPEFEVVVVNDCSWDNTEDVLREYQKVFPNLKAIHVKEDEYYKHGKKFALMVGIKGAKYEHLLLTDGDCYPNSNHWIREMMQGYTEGKEIVVGYGPYHKEPSFLNKLLRYDAFSIALQYLSLALAGKAYMGVGRNLSYKKSLFFKHKGFATHYHVNSGDDDLFVNQAVEKNNTGVILSKESLVYSIPARSLQHWTRQKSRHLTTAIHYNGATKARLTLLHGSTYLFWIFSVMAFMQFEWIIPVACAFVLRIAVQALVLYKAGKKLDEKDLVPCFLLFEILLLFLYPAWHLHKLVFKSAKWKS